MLSFRQLLFNRWTDYTALASFTSEASLLTGFSQPVLWHPALDFTQVGRQFRLSGRGVLSSTGTPTYLFKVRLGSTAMSADNLAPPLGTVIGASAALTTGSGVSNVVWSFELLLTMVSAGIGSGKATITSSGLVYCTGLSPTVGDLAPTNGSATWTTTCDSSVDNFFQVSATCSASSASNTIQLKHLELEALN